MATARNKPPERIDALLRPLVDRFDVDGQFGIVRLIHEWPDVVGPQIARRTEVDGLKFHTAVIKVSTAMWIQELNLMKPQILARLRERLGEDTVRDLRFVRGNLSRRPRTPLRTLPRAPRHAIELPALKDPQLRAAFESLIEAWGRSGR